MKKSSKVLVIATSHNTRGGITSVIKAHQQGSQWKEFNCEWIETVKDGSPLVKIFYFIKGTIDFLFKLPTADIIHVHSALGTSIKRKNFFISIAKLFHKKVILHFHAAESSILNDSNRNHFYRKIFLKADKVIVLSESWKNLLIEKLKLDSNRIEILQNPAPLVQRANHREPLVLFAGTVIPRKGYDTLIKAFSYIANMDIAKQWKLVIAGNGELDNARKLIAEYKLEDRVILPGWVSGAEKDRLFNKSSIFCLPSQAEGFPMAILDAWAYGLPCIMTPVGGIPELVSPDTEGLIVPVDDAQELSKALLKLIESDNLRKSIVENTDKRINSDFNITRINDELASIYKTC